MKFFVVLIALVALTTGHEFKEIIEAQERSISSQIVDAIEAFKLQMPCGFPGMGIGPLAPAHLSHKELHMGGDTTSFDGIIDEFDLHGLDKFDIKEFKVNAFLSRVNFVFHWHHVNLATLYNMLVKMNGKMKLNLGRDGGAKMAMKDFVLRGQIKYSLGVIGSGGLRLKEFKLYAEVGEVISEIENLSSIKIVNRKLNEIIEEWIMMAINENTDNLAEITNTMVVPIVNELIGDKTLQDILGMIGGGGGGGDPGEKEPCVPPTIKELF